MLSVLHYGSVPEKSIQKVSILSYILKTIFSLGSLTDIFFPFFFVQISS